MTPTTTPTPTPSLVKTSLYSFVSLQCFRVILNIFAQRQYFAPSFRTGLNYVVGFMNEKIVEVSRFRFIKIEYKISVGNKKGGRCLRRTDH